MFIKTDTRLSSKQNVSRQCAQVSVIIGDRPVRLVLAGEPTGQGNPDFVSSDGRNNFLLEVDWCCRLPSPVDPPLWLLSKLLLLPRLEPLPMSTRLTLPGSLPPLLHFSTGKCVERLKLDFAELIFSSPSR